MTTTGEAALVVGASSDIGRHLSLELARRGLAVHGWGRDEAALEGTVDECRALGAHASWSRVDVTRTEEMRDALGAGPLAVAVWAAGVFDWAPGGRADPATAAAVVTTNLAAAAAFTALVAPRFAEAGRGTLVYVGSRAGHTAYADNAAYVASKHGLAGLARATWQDLHGHGVRVTLLSPGLVAAGAGLWSPAGQEHPERLLQPEDVARALGFVLDFPARGCPVEVRLEPQLD